MVVVTPRPPAPSRQHYFHRTAPLYMERRIYFRSLLVERGHVMDRGDRQNFLDGSRQPARLRRTRFIASRLALDNEAARRGGFGAHRDRVLRHCQHRRHKALHIVRAVQVNERSEEHTSELQSRQYLVCRLLLEKKKKY